MTVRPPAKPPVVLAALAALSVTCGGADRGPDGAAVRDSAGVTIVESTGPPPVRVAIEGPPGLELGVAEGDPAREFAGIVGAVITTRGEIAVADGQTGEIRFFDESGAHLRTVGGAGEGPGEFVSLAELLVRGDSLIARDARAGRFSIFDEDGELLGVTPPGGFAIGLLADGRLVSYESDRVMPPPGSVTRSRGTLIVHPPGAGAADTILEYPANSRYVHTEIPGYSQRLFGRTTQVVVDRDRILVADNETPEIRVFTPAGVPRRFVRWKVPPRALSRADVTRYIETMLDDYGPRRELLEPTLRDQPPPEERPAFGRSNLVRSAFPAVLLDAAGRIWVLDYMAFPGEVPSWRAFDREGRLAASVTLPVGLEVSFVGDSTLVGVRRDALDVEHVVLFDLPPELLVE